MPKNIIVCSDGTSKTKKTRTNVYQFFDVLLRQRKDNVCFYDPGVGSFGGDIVGRAFGTGVSENIKQCYEFIVDHHQPGDRVFLFGFSRGAFTVRSLANFVDLVGLVERNHKRIRVKQQRSRAHYFKKIQTVHTAEAYQLYQLNGRKVFERRLDQARGELGLRHCSIHCIGVWDTVGAIGLPSQSNDRRAHLEHRYHRTDLSPRVRYAYQALSLDDERRVFWPNPFAVSSSSNQTVEEVWFAGMHSDVGGGYAAGPKRDGKELSNLALRWMARKMPRILGLRPDDFPKGTVLGTMHDSRASGLAKALTRRVRRPPRGSRIHASVVDRIRGPLAEGKASTTREPGCRYRPLSLVHRGTQADPEPFQPEWENGPDFGLERRFVIVDRGYDRG